MRTPDKTYNITEETFDRILAYWLNPDNPLNWDCPFVLPSWLKVWWTQFGSGSKLYLHSVRQGDELIGIVPFRLKGDTALFIGSTDVCDYQDFIVAPGREGAFFDALIEHLARQGITRLDLKTLRPESTVLNQFADVAHNRGWQLESSRDEVLLELELPASWEDYLQNLSGKQRHEVKRKLRRLQEAGDIQYRIFEKAGDVKDVMVSFLELFRKSREDKASFMRPAMVSFFNSLSSGMAEIGLIKLCLLEVDAQPAAAVMCFDYNDTIYLYNSGYDPRFRSLSVGILCKILSIKDSIQRGKKTYNFLKGIEAYKHHLGGHEVPLFRCQIRLG